MGTFSDAKQDGDSTDKARIIKPDTHIFNHTDKTRIIKPDTHTFNHHSCVHLSVHLSVYPSTVSAPYKVRIINIGTHVSKERSLFFKVICQGQTYMSIFCVHKTVLISVG